MSAITVSIALMPAGLTATVEKAAGMLHSQYRADHDTANAVAYGTVFAVCRKHARQAVTVDLDAYFQRSVKNNYCKGHGRNPLARCSSFDTLDARWDVGLPLAPADQLDAVIDLRARMCRLDEQDRDIVLQISQPDEIRARGLRLKLNTVVTALNWREDMSEFVRRVAPERWKVFQVLPIGGQNDGAVDDLLIDAAQFRAFVDRHVPLANNLAPIAEGRAR
ncbi:MAG: hypothetical protein H0T76_09945 [Nannocystis sp.]|nr:hypothetical protein [Nannocystis sp.]MBA3546792.1 hypothetical protein [Nannocystis sp.]